MVPGLPGAASALVVRDVAGGALAALSALPNDQLARNEGDVLSEGLGVLAETEVEAQGIDHQCTESSLAGRSAEKAMTERWSTKSPPEGALRGQRWTRLQPVRTVAEVEVAFVVFVAETTRGEEITAEAGRMRRLGMSLRAIGKALGVDEKTVRRAVSQG